MAPLSRFRWLLLAAHLAAVAACAQRVIDRPVAPQAFVPQWISVGPAPVTTAAGPLSGALTGVVLDPADASGATLLYSTGGGGVWRLANSSSAPLTDFVSAFTSGSTLASIAVGAVSPQPGDTGVLLAGTGEPAFTSAAHYGQGLLRSINDGQTWSVNTGTVIGTGGRQSFIGEAFSGFAWSTVSTATVVAALSASGDGARTGAVELGASVRGLYYSTDAGATWQLSTIEDGMQAVQSGETNFSEYDGNSAVSVVWNAQRQQFFAAVAGHGVYSSSDGVTFTRLAVQPALLTSCPTDPGFAADSRCPFQFAALAVQPKTGDMLLWYASANGTDQGVYLDSCTLTAGKCALPVTFAVMLENSGSATQMEQSGMALLAVPDGANTKVLAGAAQIYGCELGATATSCNLQDLSNTACAEGVQGHVLSLAAGAGSAVYATTEDGLWSAPDALCSSGNFANLNASLGSIAPVVSVAGDIASAKMLIAGAAQLGGAATMSGGTAWMQATAGDGGNVAMDSANSIGYIDDADGVGIARCSGTGGCAQAITSANVSGDAALEHVPFLLDPVAPQQLLLGTCRVWRGPADGVGWSSANAISPVLDGNSASNACADDALINTLSAGGPEVNGVSSVVYAGMSGLETGSGPFAASGAGQLYVSLNAASASPTWTNIAASPVENSGVSNAVFNADQYDISAVYADPHDTGGATVYAAVRGFGVPHVYMSVNAGTTWTNISANLPDAPANAIVVDPNDANTIYVALDTGVYITRDVGLCASQDCWQTYGTGLPTAQAYALSATGGNVAMLSVALQGRGVWQAPLATSPVASETTVKLSPSSLAFPATQVGVSSAGQTITVTNTGTLPLLATSVAITGDFSQTNTCVGATIAVGGTCSISVTFLPSATGVRSGLLTLYGNLPAGQAGPLALSGTGLTGPQIQLSPSGTMSFGVVTIGSSSQVQYVLIANVGQMPATLSNISTGGAFHITQNACGSSLAAQTGCAVGIVFTPTAAGAQNSTFAVTESSGTQTLALTGTGQTPAFVSLSPGALVFSATTIGQQSASQNVTVTNSGDAPASITGVLASGDFSAASSCGTVLTGGSSCAIAVTFLPTQAGTRTGTLTVTTPFQTVTAALYGTGVGIPRLTLTPASLSFGTLNIGQTSAPQTMTLTNTGNGSVTIVAVSTVTAVTGTADYTVTSNCTTLAPAASCTLSVTFMPAVAGPDPGTLTIQGNSANTTITAALSGAGNTLAFGSGTPVAKVPAGQVASYALTIVDDGYQGALTFNCSGLPAGASCSVPGTIVMPGSGNYSVTLKVATGSAARGTYLFTVTASGSGEQTSQTAELIIE